MTGQTIALIIAAVCFVVAVLAIWHTAASWKALKNMTQWHRETITANKELETENTRLKAELTETQATCGIWQFKVKRLEEENVALERGNQELQLQIDAAPKEPRKLVRVRVQKAKGEPING